MTYPHEPESSVTKRLRERAERESVKFLLIGNAVAVEQAISELDRKGFCDRSCWSKELPIPEAGAVATHPGEIMRVFKRWYPVSDRVSRC